MNSKVEHIQRSKSIQSKTEPKKLKNFGQSYLKKGMSLMNKTSTKGMEKE